MKCYIGRPVDAIGLSRTVSIRSPECHSLEVGLLRGNADHAPDTAATCLGLVDSRIREGFEAVCIGVRSSAPRRSPYSFRLAFFNEKKVGLTLFLFRMLAVLYFLDF